MKIVMLCDFFNEKLEYQENLLAKYYAKHGHQVVIVTSTFESVFDYYGDTHDNRYPERRYDTGSAKVIKLPYRYNIQNRLRALTPINDILVEEAPSLIFAHNIMPNIVEAAQYSRRHPESRLILDYHGDYTNSGSSVISRTVLHGMIRKRFLKQASDQISRIFPIVPHGARFLHEIYGIPHESMELLPLGADVDRGNHMFETGMRQQIRSKLGISEDEIVVFTGGKLDRLKQTDALIRAFLNVAGAFDRLVIVGEAAQTDSGYKNELLALANADKRILFVGWLSADEVYAYLAAADFAAFPASQSVMWQQAMGMRLPLILGDRSGEKLMHQPVDYLNRHNNILILEHDLPIEQALSQALGKLLRNPDLRRQMSIGAQKTTAEILDWNLLIAKTLQGVDA